MATTPTPANPVTPAQVKTATAAVEPAVAAVEAAVANPTPASVETAAADVAAAAPSVIQVGEGIAQIVQQETKPAYKATEFYAIIIAALGDVGVGGLTSKEKILISGVAGVYAIARGIAKAGVGNTPPR